MYHLVGSEMEFNTVILHLDSLQVDLLASGASLFCSLHMKSDEGLFFESLFYIVQLLVVKVDTTAAPVLYIVSK